MLRPIYYVSKYSTNEISTCTYVSAYLKVQTFENTFVVDFQ